MKAKEWRKKIIHNNNNMIKKKKKKKKRNGKERRRRRETQEARRKSGGWKVWNLWYRVLYFLHTITHGGKLIITISHVLLDP